MTNSATNLRLKLPMACIILEVIIIILFGALVQYDDETDAKLWHKEIANGSSNYDNDFYYRYPSE